MTELTEIECRIKMIRWQTKQEGSEFDAQTIIVPEISDSNWLDEIEEMLKIDVSSYTYLKEANIWKVVIGITYDATILGEAKAPTRNLARARCLCKVIDNLKGK